MSGVLRPGGAVKQRPAMRVEHDSQREIGVIAQLSGTVARTAGSYVVLDVGGVGYKVFVPVTVLEGLPPQGQPLSLVTHTLVREDDISLFGFTGEDELQVFELLLTVSGIGPKVALGLLSALPVGDLAQAVASEDVRTLTRVPGIGAKTAQRLVLELHPQRAALSCTRNVHKLSAGATVKKKSEAASTVDDVVSALINLGYNKPEAARAADAALEERAKSGAPPPEFPVLLRLALNRLTGR